MIDELEKEQSKLKFRNINYILKRLSKELMSLKTYANKINAEVDKKVNLESQITDSELTKNHILTGVISATGTDVVGTNTLFTKELTQGFRLNISNESKIITKITDDTHASVEPPGFSSFANQLATITKPVTKEELVGSFSFGNLSTPFNGSINKGSSLKHYGNMVDIADVVNVGFVLKSTNAALQRAAQAIQRDGDTVGDDASDQLNYLFQNVKWTFNEYCNVLYYGSTADPNNILVRKDLDNYINGVDTIDFYARWNRLKKSGQMKSCKDDGVDVYSPTLHDPDEETGSFKDYFKPADDGLTCLKDCKILVTYNMASLGNICGSWPGHAWHGYIKDLTTKILYSYDSSGFGRSDNDSGDIAGHVSCSAIIYCKTNHKYLIGSSTAGYNDEELRATATLTRLR